MHFGAAAKTLAASMAVLLALYSFSLLGVPGALIDSPWKLVALSIAASLVAGVAWPVARGVRKGDVLLTQVQKMQRDAAGNAWITTQPLFVTAEQQGRVQQSIRVTLPNGKNAQGTITSYASTFQPAGVRLTETEVA